MERFLKTCFFFLCCWLAQGKSAWAASGYARQDGHWNDANTWQFGANERKPGCGDSLLIDTGMEVTITAQENYSRCAEPLNIVIGGVLQFINGFKLDLPAGSVITVLPGGSIRKITPGGGNSTLITICGGIAWAARDGDLFGPAVLVCQSPLPVSLIRFQAIPLETNVTLEWSTASELNNDHFEIERSVNGLDLVTNTSAFDDCQSMRQRTLPAAAATRCSISARSEASVWQSL